MPDRTAAVDGRTALRRPLETHGYLLVDGATGEVVGANCPGDARANSTSQSAVAPPSWCENLFAEPQFQAARATALFRRIAVTLEFHRDDCLPEPLRIELTPLAGQNADWLLIRYEPLDRLVPEFVDPLTGAPDRRELQAQLCAIDEAGRDGAGAIVFLDINGFKRINDRHGHLAGDAVLGTLAERWTRELRRGDLLCRFGGDEFVAVLAEVTDRTAAAAVATRLATCAAEPIVYGATALHLTVSWGVALLADHASGVEALDAADRGMYAAKAAQQRDAE